MLQVNDKVAWLCFSMLSESAASSIMNLHGIAKGCFLVDSQREGPPTRHLSETGWTGAQLQRDGANASSI